MATIVFIPLIFLFYGLVAFTAWTLIGALIDVNRW